MNEMDQMLKSYLTEKFAAFLSDERLATIDQVLSKRTQYLQLVMENFVDPHNVNAIFRTGECFGIQEFHVVDNEQHFHVGKGVSKGASKWINIHRYDQQSQNNSMLAIEALKKQGLKVVVTSPSAQATPLEQLSVDQPMALVFGNERDGVSQEMIKGADQLVNIPMYGFTESLNVSVAAAIMIHYLVNNMHLKGVDWPLNEHLKEEYKFLWYKKSMARPDYYQKFFVNAYESEKNL